MKSIVDYVNEYNNIINEHFVNATNIDDIKDMVDK